MYTPEPQISVICVFRNRKESITPTVKALFSIKEVPCEFIIIDDASTDGSTEKLRSLMESYQNEQTYFFELDSPRGRGNCLNMALEHIRGRIIWIPESLHTVDQELLAAAAGELRSSESPLAVATEEPLPGSAIDWLQMLKNDRIPFDRNYLFDIEKIPPAQQFADPHWSSRHASEWAMRLHSRHDIISVKPFADGSSDHLAMDDRTRKECVYSLLRDPELSFSSQEKAFRMLRSFGHTDSEQDAESSEILYSQAQSLFKTGDSVSALDLLNRILASDPGHKRSRSFKISILEKMRRYVEAAEEKHSIQSRDSSEEVPDEQEAIPELQDSSQKEPAESGQDYSEETGQTPESAEPASETEKTSVQADPAEETEKIPEAPESADDISDSTESAELTDSTQEDTAFRRQGDAREDETTGQHHTAAGTSVRVNYRKEISNQLPLTIIIPTSTIRRQVLEDCLTSVFRYTASGQTKIIVIDNGSVDDTDEYLDSLIRENRPVTVLSNERNLGFAAAVNQGLAKAGDGIVVVMHNDVILRGPVPARLARVLDENQDIGLVAPKADRTWSPLQHLNGIGDDTRQNPETDSDSPFTEVDLVDGYMMAFRNEPGLTMSKDYGLAYFDDADFCFRLQKKGYRIVIDNRETVTHLYGQTTSDLGLNMRGKAYWKNAALFQSEWSLEPQFPAENTVDDSIRQFIIIGELINPFYPEKHLLDYFWKLFTSEQKTRVYNSDFPSGELKAMIRVMMAANQREILRRLEQQLNSYPPDMQLYHDLIVFYFDRTIYSRCKLYLDKIGDHEMPSDLAIYQLKIAIGEKDYGKAAKLLENLMEELPTHPEILLSAAEIHRKSGNREQSEKFMSLARTFNPYIRP
ncbi:glycosyltransferase [Natronogracilivirga saccharolytica]|uniref:Glycosyltransferase n=1 Tax=Natronogracilivirga saccharolytica TaxID=2812953 RepID=A0A8J7RN86_9BACT|nr:glycosyltransferase [Natronogracilivirga saccharolytica]